MYGGGHYAVSTGGTALSGDERARMRQALSERMLTLSTHEPDVSILLLGMYITTPPIPVWAGYAPKAQLLPRHNPGGSV